MLALYFEKDFLDDFYISFAERKHQNVVANIIKTYGEKQVYVEGYQIDSPMDLENYKKDNEFFALLCSNDRPPIPVKSIRAQLFIKKDFEQTLVFMNKEQAWFEEAEENGVLTFCFENYEERIEEIVKNIHFRIDLSEGFKGWHFMDSFKYLPYNSIVINDGYILSDREGQKIKDNLVPILQKFISDKNREIPVKIFTKELNPISQEPKHLKEKAKKRISELNRSFGNSKVRFNIIMHDVMNSFDFHDRIIQTNFSLTECGKGFNLSHSKPSNSQIISESIFDKYTYNRLKNYQKMQMAYMEKLSSLETLRFKMYPES